MKLLQTLPLHLPALFFQVALVVSLPGYVIGTVHTIIGRIAIDQSPKYIHIPLTNDTTQSWSVSPWPFLCYARDRRAKRGGEMLWRPRRPVISRQSAMSFEDSVNTVEYRDTKVVCMYSHIVMPRFKNAEWHIWLSRSLMLLDHIDTGRRAVET